MDFSPGQNKARRRQSPPITLPSSPINSAATSVTPAAPASVTPSVTPSGTPSAITSDAVPTLPSLPLTSSAELSLTQMDLIAERFRDIDSQPEFKKKGLSRTDLDSLKLEAALIAAHLIFKFAKKTSVTHDSLVSMITAKGLKEAVTKILLENLALLVNQPAANTQELPSLPRIRAQPRESAFPIQSATSSNRQSTPDPLKTPTRLQGTLLERSIKLTDDELKKVQQLRAYYSNLARKAGGWDNLNAEQVRHIRSYERTYGLPILPTTELSVQPAELPWNEKLEAGIPRLNVDDTEREALEEFIPCTMTDDEGESLTVPQSLSGFFKDRGYEEDKQEKFKDLLERAFRVLGIEEMSKAPEKPKSNLRKRKSKPES